MGTAATAAGAGSHGSGRGGVRKPHAAAEYWCAVRWVVAGVVGAVAFGATVVREVKGADGMHEWFTCYLLEQSLSLDNLFAFYALFKYFGVPPDARQRVLLYGYAGAVVFSGVVILTLGTTMRYLSPLLVLFVPILFYQAYATFFDDNEDNDGNDGEGIGEHSLAGNKVVRLARWLLPAGMMTADLRGSAFLVRESTAEGARWRATPLLLCLVCIELSDVVFSADSIPAIFAVTPDIFTLYTSNLMALVCMRSMYVLVATAVSDLPDLRRAVGCLLFFIGAKLGLEALASTGRVSALDGFEIPDRVALGAVASVLALGLLAAAIRHLAGRSVRPTLGKAAPSGVTDNRDDATLFPIDEGGPTDVELSKLLEDTLPRRGSHRSSPQGGDAHHRPRANTAPVGV